LGTELEHFLSWKGEELPEEEPAEGGRRALVIAAHPDDAEFCCAGTAALWIQDGWEFHYLVCSDGSKGTDDPQLSRERLAAIRQEEQRAAAAVLGVKDVSFLNYQDGEIIYQRELLGDIVRHIRRVRPHAVFTHEPVHIVRNMYLNHPDHRTVGTLALDAVYPIAGNRQSFPEQAEEGLEPHQVKELYLWTSNEPNLSVDITDVAGLKFKALARHRSQFAHIEERMMPRFCRGVPILPWVTSRLFWAASSRSLFWFALSRMRVWRRRWADEDGRFRENFRHIELPR
jgi:LmbE family N-acetylglucosaminyl deacetylase